MGEHDPDADAEERSQESENPRVSATMDDLDRESATVKTYECSDCGYRMHAEHQPGECPKCGGEMVDISISRE